MFEFGRLSFLVLVVVLSLGGAASGPAATTVPVEEAVQQVAGLPQSQPNGAREPAGELEIVLARYGASGKWVDVTEAVRRQISDGRVTVHVGNNLGGDPIYGTPKVLEVQYRLAGTPGLRRVLEGQELRLPIGPQGQEPWQRIRTQEQLTQLAKLCPGQVSLFARNLATGRTLEYRPDRPYCLASIVKLFVLSEVMRQEARGELNVREQIKLGGKAKGKELMIDQALDLMIGQSDNDATDALATRVGYDRVNALAKELGLAGFAPQVLPEPGVLERVLDRRIKGRPEVEPSLAEPQHGTARGLVGFFQLLRKDEVVSPAVSQRILQVLTRNPMPYAQRTTPIDGICLGKGGSLLWMRLWRREYNMGGWSVWVHGNGGEPGVAVAILCEWWPPGMSEEQKFEWLGMLTDCLVNGLTDE
jgi:hypothetical protein